MNLKLIKQKDFFLLIAGKLISLFGSNMQQFVLSLYVLKITGSATIFASILSILIVPRVFLSPIAGVFGDWFDRKKTIVILDMINAVIIGIFAVIYIINGKLSIPMIYVLVILLEITEMFFGSAMSAVIPSIVDRDDLLEANSFNSFVMNIGNMLAPVFAAFLYSFFGIGIILIYNAVSFLISAITKMFINIPKKHKAPDKICLKAFTGDLIEGINIIKSNKLISTMIRLGTVINFCTGPLVSIGFIFVMKVVLKYTDFQFGIFQMVLSVSMLLAPVLCGRIIKKEKVGKLCYFGFMYIAVLILIMSIIPSDLFISLFSERFSLSIVPYIAMLIIAFAMGLAATVANIALGTLFTQVTPLELMGRTSTVFDLVVTVSIPIGQLIFGYLYDIMLPSIVMAISGVIMLLAVLKFKTSLIGYDEVEVQNVQGVGVAYSEH